MENQEDKTQELIEFKLNVEERLQLSLLVANVDKAALMLQLARERLQQYQQAVRAKYQENGKYNLVGSLDLDTGVGTRVLAETVSVDWEVVNDE